MAEIFERVFCARDENVPEMIEFIMQLAVGLSDKRKMQLELVTEEVVVNISHYAYQGSTGQLRVAINKTAECFQLTFIDDGVAFDPTAAEPPNVTGAASERQIGGLGIYLVNKLADKVEYKRDNNQNILTLTILSESYP